MFEIFSFRIFGSLNLWISGFLDFLILDNVGGCRRGDAGAHGLRILSFLWEGAADFYGPQALSLVFVSGHGASWEGSRRLVVFCSGQEI